MEDQTALEIKSAGKNPGLEVWRIENFELKSLPKTQHGKFYIGDSYIVLNTVQIKGMIFSFVFVSSYPTNCEWNKNYLNSYN